MTLRLLLVAAALLSWNAASTQSLPWTPRSSGTLHKLRAVATSDPSVWVAVGDAGTIVRSTDGGSTWGAVSSPGTDDLHGIAFRGSIGLAVGISGAVIRSTDGGATWASVTRPTTRVLNAVAISPSSAIAVGEEGTLLHSSNDGVTWSPSGAGVANQFFCVALNADTAIAGAYLGAIANSLNGGGAWGALVMGGSLQTAPAFYGVSFTSGRTAIIVGALPPPSVSALILRSDNFGTTWIRQNNPVVGSLFAVAFTGPQKGIAVGDLGAILTTADTGNHWIQQPSGVALALNGVAFSDPNLGIAVGDSGTILQTLQGGVTSVNGQTGEGPAVPADFQLAQNYPNPFNPSTIIHYQLPMDSEVHLGVYDMLGRQVGNLVEQRQAAGPHDVRFDASRLSSGVYIYKLTAAPGAGSGIGAFTSVRKMMVLK